MTHFTEEDRCQVHIDENDDRTQCELPVNHEGSHQTEIPIPASVAIIAAEQMNHFEKMSEELALENQRRRKWFNRWKWIALGVVAYNLILAGYWTFETWFN